MASTTAFTTAGVEPIAPPSPTPLYPPAPRPGVSTWPCSITGTPVADPQNGLVYAVAFVDPGHHDLVALDLETGAVRFRVSVDPPGADALVEQQRAALALANGRVYVAFGGLFGDCGDYAGWVVGVRADGSGSLVSYRVAVAKRGGIWAPSGPAVDTSGSLYVATGNSNATSTADEGDSVLKLSPDLQLLDSFTPADWANDNRRDLDLGSVGPLLLDSSRVFQIGKPGIGYLLREEQLGGIGGEVYSAPACNSAFGGVAAAAPFVYVSCRNGLVALKLDQDSFVVAWRGPAFDSGPPIIAGGSVWAVDLASGILYGFAPESGQAKFQEDVGNVTHFTTPSGAGAGLFLASGRQIIAFSGD